MNEVLNKILGIILITIIAFFVICSAAMTMLANMAADVETWNDTNYSVNYSEDPFVENYQQYEVDLQGGYCC